MSLLQDRKWQIYILRELDIEESNFLEPVCNTRYLHAQGLTPACRSAHNAQNPDSCPCRWWAHRVTQGHSNWVVLSFLRGVTGLSLRDRVRSSDIWRGLGVEPLLLCVERGQLRWFGHQIRMPPGRLPSEMFWACSTGRKPRGRPRTCWRGYRSCLAWERVGVPQVELESAAREKGVCL